MIQRDAKQMDLYFNDKQQTWYKEIKTSKYAKEKTIQTKNNPLMPSNFEFSNNYLPVGFRPTKYEAYENTKKLL